jgi:ABC-2 type transport system permease protein
VSGTSERRGGGFFSVARTVAWRNIHNHFSHPMYFVPSLVFPLLFFTAFTGALGALIDLPGFDYEAGYEGFQYVFVLIQTAALGGVFTGFGIARDFEMGFARRLLLGAPNRTGIIAGYGVAGFTRWVFTASIVTVVAFAAGMTVPGGVSIIGLYALAFLINVAGLLFASGVAMRLRTIQAGPLMQTPVFLALFLAPVYVPLELLEGWIESIARFNPVTAFLEAGRGFLVGSPTTIALAFGLAAALIGLFALWARGGLRSAESAG